MATAVEELTYTPEQYLVMERQAECKSEYIDGRIVAMADACAEHNTITVNVAASPQGQLRGGACSPFVANMRVKSLETRMYSYPDVVVLCGRPEYHDSIGDTLLNPTVIVEVMSPATQT